MPTLSTDINVKPIAGEKIYLNYGDSYNELGALAYYIPDNILLTPTVSGSVDSLIPGEYLITYRADHGDLYNEAILTVVVNRLGVEFSMTGENPLTWNYGDPYIDPGAFLIDRSTYEKIDVETDTTEINVDLIGDYKVYYRYMDGSQATEVIRDVLVRDIQAPVFGFDINTEEGSLNIVDEEEGEAIFFWPKDMAITEDDIKSKITITDNFDDNQTLMGNLIIRYFHVVYDSETDIETETEGPLADFNISDGNAVMRARFNVADTHGNAADQIQIEFKIKLDDEPIITLTGSSPMTLEIGSEYVEPGYSAADGMGTDITSNVLVEFEGNIIDHVKENITSSFGSKFIDYSVTDNWGNRGFIQRNIIINTTQKPVINTLVPSIDLTRLSPVEDSYFLKYIEVLSVADGSTLVESVVVDQSAIDYLVHGTYLVTFNVTDSFGNVADEVTISVNVLNTTQPLHGIDFDQIDREIYQGSSYDKSRFLKGVTFVDYLGNTISEDSIEVDWMIFDPALVGTHNARYRAVDSTGLYSEWILGVIVVMYSGQPLISNSIDKIKVQLNDPYTVENAMIGVTGQNVNGTDLTGNINADISDVDTSILGSYTVTYTLTDPVNNISADSKSRIVEVIDDITFHIIDSQEVSMYEAGHVMDDTGRINGISVYDSKGRQHNSDAVVITDTTDYNTPGVYTTRYNYIGSGGKEASHVRDVIIVPVDIRDRIFISFKLPGNVYQAEIYRSEDFANYKYVYTYTDTSFISLTKGE